MQSRRSDRSLGLINIAGCSTVTCDNVIWHSANPELDNCYRDYAQQNATELADLLKTTIER